MTQPHPSLPGIKTHSEYNSHDPGGKTRIRVPASWDCDAAFSPCGAYRYELRRRWAPGSLAMFLMCNPSTADVRTDDPTVAKCGRLARRWHCGGLLVGNVCAYRATHPKRLLEVGDPVGPDNAAALLRMAGEAWLIVVAHGRLPGGLQAHADAAVRALRGAWHVLHVLRLLPDGVPTHPLARGWHHVPEDARPVIWDVVT